MSTPDAPPAEVKFGPSDLLAVIMAVSSALTAVFGHDWGVSQNAQGIAAVGAVVIPIFLKFIRSLQHTSAMLANASVTVARVQALNAPVAVVMPPTVPAETPADPVPAPAVKAQARDDHGRFAPTDTPTRTTGD